MLHQRAHCGRFTVFAHSAASGLALCWFEHLKPGSSDATCNELGSGSLADNIAPEETGGLRRWNVGADLLHARPVGTS